MFRLSTETLNDCEGESQFPKRVGFCKHRFPIFFWTQLVLVQFVYRCIFSPFVNISFGTRSSQCFGYFARTGLTEPMSLSLSLSWFFLYLFLYHHQDQDQNHDHHQNYNVHTCSGDVGWDHLLGFPLPASMLILPGLMVMMMMVMMMMMMMVMMMMMMMMRILVLVDWCNGTVSGGPKKRLSVDTKCTHTIFA